MNPWDRTASAIRSRQTLLGDGGLLIIDGAEQLLRVDLVRLMLSTHRHRQTLLATSHAPLGGMTILHRTRIDGDLVESLTQSLLQDTTPEIAEIVQHQLCRQDWTTLTNVRDLWFDLYDAVQTHITDSLRQ